MNPNWIKGGKSPNPSGRPRGVKSQSVRLREVLPVAIDNLIAAAEIGSVEASAALLQYQINTGDSRS